MFKNRALLMSLVKKDEHGHMITPPVETQADVIAFASDAAKDVLKEVTKVVIIYVVADTARRAILAMVEKL